MANKETTVGGIAGFLRLDNDQFIRAIDQAIAKTAQLDGKRVEVNVDADTAMANAQLAATEKQVDKLDRANAKIATSANNAGRGMRPLVSAVLLLGPALVPVAAGATALAAAFGGMATAGVAAFFGIKKEMEEGTALGNAYSDGIDMIKADLTGLSRMAAANVLGPFQDAVLDLDARMPALADQIGDLATVTGKATQAFLGGLLNAFQMLEPLMRDASVYVLGLARSFETAMSGQGVVAFGDYVRSVFPQVLSDLGAIVSAAAHLVEAMAPLGMGVLSGLRMLSDLLSAIPVDVLTVLTTGAWSVFAGFKAWQGISALVDGANAALGRMNSTLTLSAGALRAVNIASGVIGIALAGLSFILAGHAEANRQNEQAVNDLKDALIASNGVLDEHVRKVQLDKLVSDGVVDTYKALGGNVRDLVDASLGQADAQARVNEVLAKAKPAADDFGMAGVEVNGVVIGLTEATTKVQGAIGGANDRLKQGQQAQKDYADATSVATTAQSGAATAAQALADTYGTSVDVFDTVAEKQQKVADKAAAATLQMQLENDAAGLLKQSLDLLNGENMSAAEANNAFQRSLNSMGDPVQRAREAEARARAQLSKGSGTAGSGAPSRASTDSLAKAQLGLSQAQDHLRSVRGNPKATASQLESANRRVARAQLAVSQAQGRVSESAAKASKSTGGLSAEQRKSAEQALATAQAQVAAALSLRGNSDEAVANRDRLIASAKAAEFAAQQYGNQKDSAEAGRKKLVELREEIIRNAVAQGFNKDEVVKYLDQIMKIPKEVPPTKADLDIKEALRKKDQLQAAINGITGKTVTVTLQQVYETQGSIAAGRVHNEQRLSRSSSNAEYRANGALTLGSGIRAMASGDLLGRPASIQRLTKPILWNEAPGGEAYIPLAPHQRPRSSAILAATNAEMGNPLGVGRSGPLDLSNKTIRKLAAAMAQIRPVVGLDTISQGLAGGM